MGHGHTLLLKFKKKFLHIRGACDGERVIRLVYRQRNELFISKAYISQHARGMLSLKFLYSVLISIGYMLGREKKVEGFLL